MMQRTVQGRLRVEDVDAMCRKGLLREENGTLLNVHIQAGHVVLTMDGRDFCFSTFERLYKRLDLGSGANPYLLWEKALFRVLSRPSTFTLENKTPHSHTPTWWVTGATYAAGDGCRDRDCSHCYAVLNFPAPT